LDINPAHKHGSAESLDRPWLRADAPREPPELPHRSGRRRWNEQRKGPRLEPSPEQRSSADCLPSVRKRGIFILESPFYGIPQALADHRNRLCNRLKTRLAPDELPLE
jgi:hypothetical protein